MCRSPRKMAPTGRPGWIVVGCVASLLSASALYTPRSAAAQTPTPPRMFSSDGGMVLNFIKPDKTADFEMVIGKLKEALQISEEPERKQQAASWKVFKSTDPAESGNVLYVFMIDPSVKGADYTVSTILSEAFPAEVNALFAKYAESFAQGQNFVNLSVAADFGN